MFNQQHIARDFSNAAAEYAQHAALQARVGAQLVASAMPLIAKDGLVVDVGAGSGEVTALWKHQPIIACDLAIGMCMRARAKGITVINGTAQQLPFADGSMGAVTSNLMLQWLPQPPVFFAEAFRVLRPGGILAITSFVQGTLAELEQAFTEAGEPGRVSRFCSSPLLVQQVQSVGFELVLQRTETVVESYRDVRELCHYLRIIGAANKRQQRPRGLLTPRTFQRVKSAYPKTGEAIQASWAVLELVARKRR